VNSVGRCLQAPAHRPQGRCSAGDKLAQRRPGPERRPWS